MTEARMSDRVRTRIWYEHPEPGDRFATHAAFCRGYSVYADMLGQARWVEMLWLLFREEAPQPEAARLMEGLAVAMANAGPRDPAVHAAMCAGVGGSPAASALMAALAVGAGRLGGAQEVAATMSLWLEAFGAQAALDGVDAAAWGRRMTSHGVAVSAIWPQAEHLPGFEPNGVVSAGVVRDALHRLSRIGAPARLSWLALHREDVEAVIGKPLGLMGVFAAGLCDLGFTPDQGEMLCLLLRLPGAAAHALEQRSSGYKDFPFFGLELQDDPFKEAA